MLNEKVLREIKEYEKAGLYVVVTGSDGTLEYSTQEMGGCEYCNQCNAFKLISDSDMKAVCLEVNGVIAGYLENPSEWTNLPKPLYCPRLGRELSEEEKVTADKMLKWAKERMKGR